MEVDHLRVDTKVEREQSADANPYPAMISKPKRGRQTQIIN